MLKVATLFSGIGTPEQSLKHLQVEHETVFACEWDKYARITYLTNNQAPGKFYEDVKTLDATKYKDQVDILIAGFPCQAFSIAGKQLGFEDTRGTYFFDTAKAVKECSPKVFVFENVEGLISNDKPRTPNCLFKTYRWEENIKSNHNVFFNHGFLLERIYLKKQKEYIYSFKDKEGVFLNKVFYKKGYPSFFNKSYDGHKKGIGKTLYTMEKVMLDLGYKSITWDVVNTKDYLVPQNRSRIYIVGFRDNVEFEFAPKQELKLRLKDMLEDEVDEKYSLNQTNINFMNTTWGKDTRWRKMKNPIDGCAGTICATHSKGLPRGVIINDKDIQKKIYKEGIIKLEQVATLNIKGNDSIKRIYSSEGLCPSLTTMQGGHREPKVAIKNDEVAKYKISETIKPSVARNIQREMSEILKSTKDFYVCKADAGWQDNKIGLKTSPTIRANNSSIYGLDRANYIFRKLTPRECFRLQGFNDSFIFPSKMSDTQLYKQAGNGMSRNILDMIFTQIFTCYAKHIENIKE